MTNSRRLCLIFLTPLFLATAADARGNEVIRLSEPVTVTDRYEEFGAPLTDGGPVLTLSQVVAEGDRHLGQPVLLRTEVAKVCQKKGCFFIARDGDTVARVTFRDYEFFIPTDSGGKEVTLAGVFERRALSAEQAEHLAADLGEPEADFAPVEYHIVASAIRIPRG